VLNLAFRPHRAALKSASTDEQKLFAMLKVIPKGEVAGARPPLAIALVIDTSSSMGEFAEQERAGAMIRSRGLHVQHVVTEDGSRPAVDLSLPTKLDRAIQAAQTLINDTRLSPDDTVAVIHFDDNARSLLPLSPLSRKQAALEAADSLRNHSGGTLMAKGLRCAERELSAFRAA
jgi:Ca-activated chloride channel homolog